MKAPLYVDTEVQLSKVAHAFEEGQCHMGIVCDQRSDAGTLRDFCDDVHTQILNERVLPPPSEISESSMIGVLTLEDVIERQLRLDIIDEIDRDEAISSLLLKSGDMKTMNYKPLLEHKYETEATLGPEDKDGIYSSNFAKTSYSHLER
jgi:hypothetical protein